MSEITFPLSAREGFDWHASSICWPTLISAHSLGPIGTGVLHSGQTGTWRSLGLPTGQLWLSNL